MTIYPQEYTPINKHKKSPLPASESSFWLNLLSLIPAFAILSCIKIYGEFSNLTIFFVFILSVAVSALVLEFYAHKFSHSSYKLKFCQKPNFARVMYKLYGLFFIWLVMGFLYWLFPVYNDKLFVKYFAFIQSYWWIGGLVAIAYFILMDSISSAPNDDIYYKLGRKLCFCSEQVNRLEIIELWRGWGVKFFFCSLMLPYLYQRLSWFIEADLSNIFHHPYSIFYNFDQLIFLVDLAFASVGYLMTFRLFNTHIRSSEPTLLGWIVALGCYWPFWGVLLNRYYFQYSTGVSWISVWENTGIWFILWMSMILLCELIYTLSTIAMGLRFSNLTYRGLVTSGPYRFTKHPAYVFKNISWWLISMPFMAFSKDWELALRGSLLLLGVNILYYLRAKTEENHLSHYPEYVEYALTMNNQSIFAPIAKLLPFLKYKAPKS